MRYAPPAFLLLLLLGMFGLSAPVVADGTLAPRAITVDVTGPDPVSETDDPIVVSFNATGVTGNFSYSIVIRLNGFAVYSKGFLGTSLPVNKNVVTSGWGTFVDGVDMDITVTVNDNGESGNDTLSVVVGP